MRDDGLQFIVMVATAFFASLAIFIIYFVILYRNKQIINKQEQEKLQSEFHQELLETRIEIQEQTLVYVSREIHDNITQVLSFVKLNLGMIHNEEIVNKKKVDESRELVAQTINDLRNLSKSLSFEHIASFGLIKTIEIEVERINNSGLINAVLLIEGETYPLGEQRELVLFRIFQEALNNTLKYAGAKHFRIGLQYQSELFNLSLDDDGAGFSAKMLPDKRGAGLKNMESRATLIGATATIDSSPGKGCCVKVTLNPLEEQLYTDGNHPNRPGR